MSVALVTGGGRGIGLAIATALAQEGFAIAIASLEPERDVAAALAGLPRGARVLYRSLDVGDLAAHAPFLAAVEHELGPVDCLVNNAGVTSLVRGDLLDLAPESFDRCLGVNLRGTFFLTQAVARRMVAVPATRYRSIVTITSANAELLGPDRADYCVSKAALAMASRLFAARLAAHGIHVFEVRPGIIRTDMTAPATAKYDAFIAGGGVPLGRWGTPEDVGRTVATLARGDLPFVTGSAIDVGGGLQLHRL